MLCVHIDESKQVIKDSLKAYSEIGNVIRQKSEKPDQQLVFPKQLTSPGATRFGSVRLDTNVNLVLAVLDSISQMSGQHRI